MNGLFPESRRTRSVQQNKVQRVAEGAAETGFSTSLSTGVEESAAVSF